MISIVTAYYNRRELFLRTLESIAKTKYDGDFEVIAVDDGSRNEERLEDLKKDFPFLKIIYLDPTKKWYHNSCIPFNIGIRAAKGDKIILQNPECYHYGDILLKTEEELTDKDYLSFACFSLDKYTTDNFGEVFNSEYFKNLIIQHNNAPTADGDAGWYNHSKLRPHAYHFCTAITKKNINKLGGFDERFALGIAYDDDELIQRVKKIVKIKFLDDVIVLHQNHYNPQSTSFQNKANKQYLYGLNKFLLHNKIPILNFNKYVSFIPINKRKTAIKLALKMESFLRYAGLYKPAKNDS
ncbi:MAG: glycosyltransferase family 2 protein [Soonwooa sp.]